MGKATVILPPAGKETGRYSARIAIITKNSMESHTSEKAGIVGNKNMKSIIADIVISKIKIFNLFFNQFYSCFNYL
jgi:hypothetical protein